MTEATGRLAAALQDRYQIERELGQGGMATVYLAHDLRHDRPVALKVLRAELAAVIGAERFLAEIKTTANLQHPHILPLFDSGSADSFLYYVMPYVEGESLRDRLSREKQLPVDEAVRIATEVAEALEYAHEQGVIHRDIKPENILLHGGHALVADFGIALAVTKIGGPRMTETGLSLGTPSYMSPEQAMGEREITPRADIYALGCVLYEMLLGEPPFTGPTAQAVVAKVMTEKPGPIVARRERVPPWVEEAVFTALEKLPADRFATAAQFAEALRAGAPPPARAAPARSAAGTRAWIQDWRSWVTAGVAMAAVSVAVLSRRGPASLSAPVARFDVALPGRPTPSLGNFLVAPAISPDGTILVYDAMARDSTGVARRELFARRLDAIEPTLIPGTEGGRAPFFSPDGRWIGFWVGPRLVKVPVTGGTPITLADSTDPFMSTGSWGSDGTVVFPIAMDALGEVDARGGTVRILYRDSTRIVEDPTVLPDGKSVLFLRCRRDDCGQHQEVAVVNLASRVVRILTAPGVFRMVEYLSTGHLLYVRGDLLVRADAELATAPFDLRKGITGDETPVVEHVQSFSISRTGTLVTIGAAASRNTLVVVGLDGTEHQLGDSTRDYLFPAVSPDGRRVAMEIHDAAGGQIWVYDTTSRALTRLTSQGHNTSPVWSPDAARIAYSSARGAASAIYAVPADGGGLEQRIGLAAPAIAFARLSWSRGGARIAYESGEGIGSVSSTFTVAAAPDSVGRAVPQLGRRAGRPVFSGDGRWLAYVESQSGRDEVYVSPFPGPGGRWAVSAGGGDEPVWAPSGRTLFYRGADGWLYAATLALGGPVLITHRARLFDTRPYVADAGYDVFPDGRHFVFVREDRASSTVGVTLNWFTDLDQRLQAGRGARRRD